MHSSQHCCVFRIIFIVLSRAVAVLAPRATAPLWSRDATDTVAFVSHLPRGLQGSQMPYICRGTKRPVSGPREKGLIRRWVSRGQDVIVCFSSVLRHGSIWDAAEGGALGVKRLFVIISHSSYRLKTCSASTTPTQLQFTLQSILLPEYFPSCHLLFQDFLEPFWTSVPILRRLLLLDRVNSRQMQSSKHLCGCFSALQCAQICHWSVCTCLSPCLCLLPF